MNRPLLDRRQLEQRNRSSLRYPLGIAEKDYFLAVAWSIIYASPLKDKLVFKGGTALHHCYLPQYRFSEDLDFTASDKNLQMEEIGGVLEDSGIFRVRKQRQSSHTIKLDRLQYSGVLGQPGNIKVEIDTTQNVAQEVFARTYANVWGMEIQPYTALYKHSCHQPPQADFPEQDSYVLSGSSNFGGKDLLPKAVPSPDHLCSRNTLVSEYLWRFVTAMFV